MGTLRTVVFPALRLLVWAVIAGALAVLAFRGGADADVTAGPGAPTVDRGLPARSCRERASGGGREVLSVASQ
jgi:membrane fusion protein (multidrug efflux system)